MASSTFEIYFSATRQKISEFDYLELKMIELLQNQRVQLCYLSQMNSPKNKKKIKDNFVIKNRKVIRKLITKINLKKFLAKFDFQKVIFKLNIKTLLETL